MSKRLILVLALALVACFSVAAYAEVQNVKVSGDITTLGIAREDLAFCKEATGYDAHGFAAVTRLRVDANLTENVDATVRLLSERVWGVAETNATTDIDVDLANVALKEFMTETTGIPLTVIVGRQEIFIGDGVLIGANGANQSNTVQMPRMFSDLSVRSAFDGVVGVWQLVPELTLITGYVKANEGDVTVGGDTDVAVVDASYAMGEDMKNTTIGATYVINDGESSPTSSDVQAFGARVALMPVQNFGVKAGYYLQLARHSYLGTWFDAQHKTKRADAYYLMASLGMPDVVWAPTVAVDYWKFSDRWNPLHEAISPADLANFIFQTTNCRVIGATVMAKPADDLGLKVRYARFDLARKLVGNFTSLGTMNTYTMNNTKTNLGSEVDLGMTYDYTSDVQFGVNYGIFMPGKAFDATNKKSAKQVVGSMKVTF